MIPITHTSPQPQLRFSADTPSLQNLSLLKRVVTAVITFFSLLTFSVYKFSPFTSWNKNTALILKTEDPLFPVPSEELNKLNSQKKSALKLLKQIEEKLVTFELSPSVRTFDLDGSLARFDSAHSPREFLYLFDFACSESEPTFTARRARFAEILREYDPSETKELEQIQTIRILLSRFYSFFLEKIARISSEEEERDALEKQIRSCILQIIDAHENCIDQVLSQFESLTLDVLASEVLSEAASAKKNLQMQAALVLFQYKSNLIRATCYKQNSQEPHMADLERCVKQKIAPWVGLDSNINQVGAVFESIVENRETKISLTARAFLRRYLNQPAFLNLEQQIDHWDDLDEQPISYLLRELISADSYNPVNSFRNNLIIWGIDYFGLQDENAAEILARASEDPENDLTLGGNLSLAGAQLLLESAGIIRQF